MKDKRIQLIKGDITQLQVDAVVNAANTSLLGGGGVDGAIHKAAGAALSQECEQIHLQRGGCEVGEAVITTAGNMPARFVIHTVGPIWRDGRHREKQLLASAYQSSLELAFEKGLKSVAFPNISTGVYGFPKEEAAEIAIQAVSDYLQKHPGIEEVLFVCFDEENHQIYQNKISSILKA